MPEITLATAPPRGILPEISFSPSHFLEIYLKTQLAELNKDPTSCQGDLAEHSHQAPLPKTRRQFPEVVEANPLARPTSCRTVGGDAPLAESPVLPNRAMPNGGVMILAERQGLWNMKIAAHNICTTIVDNSNIQTTQLWSSKMTSNHPCRLARVVRQLRRRLEFCQQTLSSRSRQYAQAKPRRIKETRIHKEKDLLNSSLVEASRLTQILPYIPSVHATSSLPSWGTRECPMAPTESGTLGHDYTKNSQVSNLEVTS
ncbi:hypothetical protein GBA52_008396 [Prunus armeniaca]|nr:hypothetical protein GBA52_008396 [Prunus armeniaca]